MEDVIVCGECKGAGRVCDVGRWVACPVCSGLPVVAVDEIADLPADKPRAKRGKSDADPKA